MTVRVDERTGWLVALCALDNLVKGAAGQAVQCANLALGLRRGDRPARSGRLPVSVTAPRGLRGRRWVRRDQGGRGARRWRWWPPMTGGPCPRAAVFTSNLAPGGAGPGQPVAPGRHRRPGCRGGAHVGQRQRRHRRAGGRGRARRLCDVVAAGIGARDRGGPDLPDRTDRGAVSRRRGGAGGGRRDRRAGRPGEEAGPAAADGHHDHRHRPQGGDGRRRAAPSRWAAWPRGRPCWPPTWPPCWRC